MSDMIDRLDAIAGEVGAEARDRLSSTAVAARLAGEVRGKVRRRRAIAAGATAVGVVIVGAAATVLPSLLRSEPVEPVGPVRVPIEAEDGLITYDDGSMQVLDSHGHAVNIPAATADTPQFKSASIADACAATLQDLSPGWTMRFDDAFKVMTFGRPLQVDAAGYRLLPQGERVTLGSEADAFRVAFSMDADPAIAPHLVMVMTAYVLAPDGRVAWVGSQMESRPAIEYTGDKAAGTYTATVTSRALMAGEECRGVSSGVDQYDPAGLVHYLTVDVFINDGHGHINPVGTHTSWITLVKETS